jgi:hypothetical protein
MEPPGANFSVITAPPGRSDKWAMKRRVRIVNLGTGTDVSKLRWSTIVTKFRSIIRVSLARVQNVACVSASQPESAPSDARQPGHRDFCGHVRSPTSAMNQQVRVKRVADGSRIVRQNRTN